MDDQEDIEAMEQELYVQINVEAEDEDDQCFHWSCRLPAFKSLHPLKAKWAEAHGVTEAAVGFEDYLEREVDLNKTPADLGWTPKATVHVHAVPVDDRFAEGAEGEMPSKASKSVDKVEATKAGGRSEPSPLSALAARLASKRQQVARPAAAALPAPAAEEAPVAEAEECTQKFPEPAEAARPILAAEEAPVAEAVECTQKAPEPADESSVFARSFASAVATAGSSGHSLTIHLEDDEDERPAGCQQNWFQELAPEASTENVAAPLRKRPREATSRSVCPLEDEPVTFQARNPKKAGTASAERYDKYKVAKTRREAMQLGASKGDLQHDFKKGFMKRC